MAAVLVLAVLVVMTHLAEGGCCTALPSQFAYTQCRNHMSRASLFLAISHTSWQPALMASYPTLTLGNGGVYVLHLP
jgi:hypothetical protein